MVKGKSHDISVIVLDVGSSMTEDEIEEAKQITDWIISRKIFTNSSDELRLVLCGSNQEDSIDYPSVHVHRDEFETATFDMLRFLKREVTRGNDFAQISSALIVALDLLKEESDGRKDIEGKQIVLLTNGDSGYKCDEKDKKSIIDAVKSIGVDVVVIGIDDNIRKHNRGGNTVDLAIRFEEHTEGTIMSFKEALHGLSHFSRSSKDKRGSPFSLELSPNVKIPVKSYVKTKYNPKLNSIKYVHPDAENSEVVRERVFVQIIENEEDVDMRGEEGGGLYGRGGDDDYIDKKMVVNGSSSNTNEGLIVNTIAREKVKKAFKFGLTVISLEEEELTEYNGKKFRQGKCLQLVQCAKKNTLNPSHLLGKETRVFLIDERASPAAQSAFSSLTRTCLSEDTVMIVRYAYSAAANPSLLALFPYEEDSGNMALAGIRLAFYEDIRPLQFPPFNENTSKPTTHQLQLVDELIDGMQLSSEDGTDIDSELILQPSYQRVCDAVKRRALNDNDIIDNDDNQSGEPYLKSLRPNSEMLKRVYNCIEGMKDEERGFELIRKEKIKRPRMERIPENIDDLIEEIEKNRLNETMTEEEEKIEMKPVRKFTFKEKALGMKNIQDLHSLRMQIDSVLDAAEDDEAFFPRISLMLSHLRDGVKISGLNYHFDEILKEIKESYYLFTSWMNQQDDQVLPLNLPNSNQFWGDTKDII